MGDCSRLQQIHGNPVKTPQVRKSASPQEHFFIIRDNALINIVLTALRDAANEVIDVLNTRSDQNDVSQTMRSWSDIGFGSNLNRRLALASNMKIIIRQKRFKFPAKSTCRRKTMSSIQKVRRQFMLQNPIRRRQKSFWAIRVRFGSARPVDGTTGRDQHVVTKTGTCLCCVVGLDQSANRVESGFESRGHHRDFCASVFPSHLRIVPSVLCNL